MLTRLGLTGGIGSGKSTVAAMLAQQGASVIDADAVSRQLTAPGGDAMPAIAQAFGTQFLTPQGALDRPRMRDLVFHSPEARQRLESIIHPQVQQVCRQQAELAAAAGQRCLVFDIPLLVESGHWRTRLDRVLVIDCETETQIQRVMTRSGLSRTAVEAVMGSQARREDRLAAADAVIYNDGDTSLSDLSQEVSALGALFGL